MTDLRLGLIGAGAVAALHADAAGSLPGVRIAAICDIDVGRAEQLASGREALVFDTYQALLRAGAVDAVIVNLPHALHAEVTCAASDAGLHVLVEKPMATTIEDCDAMIAAAAMAGVRLAVGNVQRFLPGVRRAHELLARDQPGRARIITERRAADYLRPDRPAWFLDPRLAGGGTMLNLGVHCLDKVLWLGGASATTAAAHIGAPPGVEVETEAISLLGLANGVHAVVAVTGTGLPGMEETEIVCTNGGLRLSRRDGLWAYDADGRGELVRAPGADDLTIAFRDQLAAFVRSVQSQTVPEVGGDYGRSIVATALAIYQAAATGSTVPVDIGSPH